MQHLTLLTFAAAVAASVSINPANSLFRRQQPPAVVCDDASSVDCVRQENMYFQEVCTPYNVSSDGTMTPDLNIPCNAAAQITAECIFGAGWNSTAYGTTTESSSDDGGIEGTYEPAMLSNTTQRSCLCESQFFNQALGCADCYQAHGASADEVVGFDGIFLSSISASYCAATNTPTMGLADILYQVAETALTATSSSSSATATGTGLTIIDNIGNKTEVSYYFTPSVTGSAAYVVAQATETPSNSTMSASASGSASSSSASESLNTNSAGQIVPTAAGASGTASASSTASGAAASKSSSASTKQEAAAFAGVLALAGFVAIL